MARDAVSGEWVARFRRNVRRWYARCGRELPWVGERDPYVVWVREIMLQQTTVTAVVPYLDRFLKRFPDDSVASIYLDRCSQFSATPPASDWDGVFSLKSK